jgi:hypothetical protein
MMPALAPGRVVRRHVGRFTARPDDLRQRIFLPAGRVMRACPLCGKTHITGAACQALAVTLRDVLARFGLADQEATTAAFCGLPAERGDNRHMKAIPFPALEPIHTDDRWRAASETVDALRERAESIKRRRAGGIVHDADPVAALLADPNAPLTPAADPTLLAAEERTILAAVASAEADLERVRGVVSAERLAPLQAAHGELAHELVALLTRAIALIQTDVGRARRHDGQGYRHEAILPRMAYPGDAETLVRQRDRIVATLSDWQRTLEEVAR